MQAVIDIDDLRLLRIAARRWAVEHPENPNCNNVFKAVIATHPKVEWILLTEEKRRPGDKE
jgi:hypothetical protein